MNTTAMQDSDMVDGAMNLRRDEMRNLRDFEILVPQHVKAWCTNFTNSLPCLPRIQMVQVLIKGEPS